MPALEVSLRDPAEESRPIPIFSKCWVFVLQCVTVFVSAFLLFSIQPVMGRLILPIFGGSASVWSACMVFFQAILLAGYAYADWTSRKLSAPAQGWVHAGLLGTGVLLLPAHLRTSLGENVAPALQIVIILAVTIGPQYFLLSSTSPLVQMWWARQQGTSPYRLYALSNLGSLLALLSYPVLIEPNFSGRSQVLAWSIGFGLFAVMCAGLALVAARLAVKPRIQIVSSDQPSVDRIGWGTRALWVTLAAIPSALLLATTNHLCQNVAAIPFLWIVPLAAYLVTLILCFDFDSNLMRGIFQCLAPPALIGMGYFSLHGSFSTDPRVMTPVLAAGLFIICMVFHGELVNRRPAGTLSSSFYLMVSLGGAIGGALIVWVAPLALSGIFEMPILLTLGAVALLFLYYRKRWWVDVIWAATSIAVLVFAMQQIQAFSSGNRVAMRNFYGALRIVDSQASDGSAIRIMVHGSVSHGSQFQDAKRRNQATTYYAVGTGAAMLLQKLNASPLQVAVIGLGAGSLAAYSKPEDHYVFFELNPQVIELAKREFTYLQRPNVEVVQGDGRLMLQRDPRKFDVIIVDAFSGDAIPTHLLTREAAQIYERHLMPNGVLGIHISNLVVDLEPAVSKLAESQGMSSILVAAPADEPTARSPSVWALMSKSIETLRDPALDKIARPLRTRAGQRLWTDDYSNLFQLLK